MAFCWNIFAEQRQKNERTSLKVKKCSLTTSKWSQKLACEPNKIKIIEKEMGEKFRKISRIYFRSLFEKASPNKQSSRF